MNINYLNNTKIITISKTDCIKLLTYIYQFAWPNYSVFTISCNGVPLIITENYINNYGGDPISYIRLGILKSIVHYED